MNSKLCHPLPFFSQVAAELIGDDLAGEFLRDYARLSHLKVKKFPEASELGRPSFRVAERRRLGCPRSYGHSAASGHKLRGTHG